VTDDRAVDLPDGTTVGLYEYGDPDGRPVFAFHGVPACGAGFDWADEPARIRGLRLLAPDRPGIGKSSGPALADAGAYPARIAACVALRSTRYSSTKRCCRAVRAMREPC